MESLVIDIHRCSIHDGPGIRTTVFLKGCPLRCKWCHNPESLSFKKQLSFNKQKCTGCMSCVSVCDRYVHKSIEGEHIVDFESCNSCGKCIDICKTKSLSIVGKEMSVDEIITIIKKDISFYKSSGGGVTISGGEILSNSSFARDILKECRELGIHTCIQTSGFGRKESIDNIIEYVDLVLFDYKISDIKEHNKYTGVNNDIILHNLEYIYNLGKKIIIRCPIVPGVNDNKEHFEAINTLIDKYSNIEKVELLPYHNMGVNKGNKIGYNDTVIYEVPEKYDKDNWMTFFKEHLSKVKIS